MFDNNKSSPDKLLDAPKQDQDFNMQYDETDNTNRNINVSTDVITKINDQSPQSNNTRANPTTSIDTEENAYFLSPEGTKRPKKFADLMLSPVRYTQRKFRAGGTSGSIFSLIAATLGSGTISFSYAIAANGIILGSILIILGAVVSYYTGMLLVIASNHTGRTRYEDIAQKLYGNRCKNITVVLNLLCLCGFSMSYIVYIKSMIPEILLLFWTKDELPSYMDDSFGGQAFWGTIFTFLVLLPMSLPREVNALRFTSLFGVLCSIYLCFAVFFVFFCDSNMIPDRDNNFANAEYFTFTFSGFTGSVPLIIFGYMYQVNIPMIYNELQERSYNRMSKVLILGSSAAVFAYLLVGIFGYLTFDSLPGQTAQEALSSKNILQAPYDNNIPIMIGNFALFFAILTASPLCVLPSKDSVEELYLKGTRLMTPKENFIITFLIILVCYILALFIPNIGAAMTIVGSTTNPAVGFILPIVFYFKTIPNLPLASPQKITGLIVGTLIVTVSVLGLVNFFMEVASSD